MGLDHFPAFSATPSESPPPSTVTVTVSQFDSVSSSIAPTLKGAIRLHPPTPTFTVFSTAELTDFTTTLNASNFYRQFQNYTVNEEIARGATSVVYRAICKRGRLRNRQVALKKVPISSSACEDTRTTTISLHQALHHPSIVSLFSEFATPSDSYQVLELCPRGSLSSLLHSRRPSVLSEDELRGILKSVVDALAYLRKQRILHGDINPDNVLLTDDLRAKLSGFSHAFQLSTVTSTISDFHQTNAYFAPEIVSQIPYTFSADVWSLGCLMSRCLTGSVSREPSSTGNSPHTLSPDAEDLMSQMLQTDPDHRITLDHIVAHPFFKPAVKQNPPAPASLNPRPPLDSEKENVSTPRPTRPSKYPALLSKGVPPSGRPLLDLQTTTMRTGKVLADARDRDLRRALSDEISGSATPSVLANRFASAPQSSTLAVKTLRVPSTQPATYSIPVTPTLTDDTASVSSQEEASCDGDALHALSSGKPEMNHPLLPRPYGPVPPALSKLPRQTRIESQSSQGQTAVASGAPSLGQASRAASAASALPESMPRQVLELPPLHAGRRAASAPRVAVPPQISPPEGMISTAYLSPQTHKVAHGQLVILPSKSLLVDFREGDRRRGKRGNEVLLISPGGATIQVYSAPHLSTPCCLAEPLATHALGSLPEVYSRAYDDARRLVNQLKQRVPKLVLHKPGCKCTLMANEPLGDIELTFGRGSSHERFKGGDSDTPDGTGPQMRVSLRRRRQTVEVARFIPSPSAQAQAEAGTGEWTRRVLPVTMDYLCVSDESLAALEPAERDGLDHLARFLRLCEALEGLERELGRSGTGTPVDGLGLHPGAAPAAANGSEDELGVVDMPEDVPVPQLEQRRHARPQASPAIEEIRDEDEGGTLATVATTASTRNFPSLELAPRPAKFSLSLASRSRATPSASRVLAGSGSGSGSALSGDIPVSPPASCIARSSDQMCSEGDSSGAEHLETRFIRSVGWCMRSASAGSQSYKIMFQDGATLQVDLPRAGEETVWYAEAPQGQLMRLSGASAARIIPKRMEAYSMFVEMFCVN
ncbi:hypothetical protein DAEQUDRAFT_807948 [Daedalea quercina L-15889]|uniref:Uncharacterized protein n=1 Tax=Daedalea quercina L-15889 TaxID=1314783 RepID=A0A165TPB3_9APHY|nr:hypothetical protein DAEQUDRAFT_807948 [Daedalea quercina L-15889]